MVCFTLASNYFVSKKGKKCIIQFNSHLMASNVFSALVKKIVLWEPVNIWSAAPESFSRNTDAIIWFLWSPLRLGWGFEGINLESTSWHTVLNCIIDKIHESILMNYKFDQNENSIHCTQKKINYPSKCFGLACKQINRGEEGWELIIKISTRAIFIAYFLNWKISLKRVDCGKLFIKRLSNYGPSQKYMKYKIGNTNLPDCH